MKNTVMIQFEIEGFHNYPEPPKKVDFLKHNHRHSFVIKAGYKVTELNRELEIFMLREVAKEYLIEMYGCPCQFENMSCEIIAQDILLFFKEDNMIWCEVWEEQTGGAKVEL